MDKKKKYRSSKFFILGAIAGVGAIAGALLLGLYWLRPTGMIHGVLMYFYMNPLFWMLPILSLLLIIAAKALFIALRPAAYAGRDWSFPYKLLNRRSKRSYRGEIPSVAAWSCLVVPIIAMIFGASIQGVVNSAATYNHYKFTEITELPQTESVRIMPFEVAQVVSSSGFDSSTSKLGSMKIVADANKQMNWTFGQLPDGLFRTWTRKTQGSLSQPADITSRKTSLDNTEFKFSPGQKLTDGLRWQLYKINFLSNVPSTVFMSNDDAEPVIVAPYIEYKGFFTKVPVLGGIYVVDAEGNIEDLSPEEAAATPFLANSGQIIPDSLALDIQNSYAYKNGIWNKLFIHEDQTEIVGSSGGNDQPYLNTFKQGDPDWVTTAEPYGTAYATKAVFLTDSVTGETQVWSPPEGSSLSGNARALEVVRGLAIPGVTFDKFDVVEPRPIVHLGRLQFVVSVVPTNYNGVTKTAIVDAADNKVIAIFNHDTDPGADAELKAYIAGAKEAVTPDEIPETDSGQESGVDPGSSAPAELDDQAALIRQLIEANKQEQALLEELARFYSKKK